MPRQRAGIGGYAGEFTRLLTLYDEMTRRVLAMLGEARPAGRTEVSGTRPAVPCDYPGCVTHGTPAIGEEEPASLTAGHLARRGDDVEAWLKRWRNRHPNKGVWAAAWHAIDNMLDDYRLHADTGTPLGEDVRELEDPETRQEVVCCTSATGIRVHGPGCRCDTEAGRQHRARLENYRLHAGTGTPLSAGVRDWPGEAGGEGNQA